MSENQTEQTFEEWAEEVRKDFEKIGQGRQDKIALSVEKLQRNIKLLEETEINGGCLRWVVKPLVLWIAYRVLWVSKEKLK